MGVNIQKSEEKTQTIEPIKKSKAFIYQSLGLSPDTNLVIEDGRNVDMSPLERTIPIPSIRTFTYVKYFKVKSKR